jgi:hypothetical protein
MNTDEHGFHIFKRPKNKRPDGTQMNTDKHRFYILERLKNKRPNGTRMNTDTHGSLLKGKKNAKTVRSLSKSQVPKVSFSGQAIPEIPPSPPFSKGGLGGISGTSFPLQYA